MVELVSVHDAGRALGCHHGALRHWRSIGLLDGIGERVGREVRYTRGEIARIALACFLAPRIVGGLRQALAFANDHAAEIDALVRCGGVSSPAIRIELDAVEARGVQPIKAVTDTADDNIWGELVVYPDRVVRTVLTRLAASK